tara:strand:+ start:4773 stop:5618 length:846 start_codon:yes stop_codon:yes gene_type:complete
MATPYLNGYSVKPASVDALGVVTFTDGTNEITPNQQQCEAYGYSYNQATGSCDAFTLSTTLGVSLNNETNKLQGAGNVVETGTNNTSIVGENNTVKGLSRNNIIIGSNNEISHGVDNANVYGTLAQATADNSIVLGCNAGADILGERQNITLMYGKQTTDNSTVDAFLNNTTDSYFVVPDNAVIYFQSETIAVRVAGSSGSGAVGDFKSWVERGVVKNARGVLSIDRSRTSPADSGTTTGWSPINAVSGTNFRQTIKGGTDMTIEWASTIRITQIQTSVLL